MPRFVFFEPNHLINADNITVIKYVSHLDGDEKYYNLQFVSDKTIFLEIEKKWNKDEALIGMKSLKVLFPKFIFNERFLINKDKIVYFEVKDNNIQCYFTTGQTMIIDFSSNVEAIKCFKSIH